MTDHQAKEMTQRTLLSKNFADFCVKVTAIAQAGLTPVITMGNKARTCGYTKNGGNTLLEAWDIWCDCHREHADPVLVGTHRTQ